MEVVVASHPASLAHDTGVGHPEAPSRLAAVRRGIDGSGLRVVDVTAPLVDRGLLETVHDPGHVEMISQLCSRGGGSIDTDTVVSPESCDAALRSAGGAVELVSQLESRDDDAFGFALCRPPGHHASRGRAMGFCLFNNVCVATSLLRSNGQRVAILDWDVHHGNGTQSIVEQDPDILYVSLHQDGHYPLTGQAMDVEGSPGGTTVNIPLPYGTGGDVYRIAWSHIVLAIVAEFSPDWILISAGFDAHARDPLAGMNLLAADFGWMASSLARSQPGARTIFALEGGYDLSALEESTASVLRGVGGATDFEVPLKSPSSSLAALDACRSMIGRFWPIS